MKKRSLVHERRHRANGVVQEGELALRSEALSIAREDAARFSHAFQLFAEQHEPTIEIEKIEKTSLIGRLAIGKNFRIAEYIHGKNDHAIIQTKHRLKDTTRGWLLNQTDVKAKDNDHYTNAIVISQAGETWGGGYRAFGTDSRTVGVIGEGNFVSELLQSALEDPRTYNDDDAVAFVRSITEEMLTASSRSH